VWTSLINSQPTRRVSRSLPGKLPIVAFLPIVPLVSLAILHMARPVSPVKPESAAAPLSRSAPPVEQRGACPTDGSTLRLFLVVAPVKATDSTARVSVCVSSPSSQPSIGSLRAVITFDTLAARFTGFGAGRSSGLAMNSRKGAVEFAGAAPQGLRAGELLSITLKLATRGSLPPLRLDVVEAADRDARSIVTRIRVESLGPADCVAHAESSVRLSVLTPTEALAGQPAVVEASGCGFDATTNTIRFGDITIANVPSTAGGTKLRFRVPTEIRVSREVPPMQVDAGKYPVTIRTSRATTNALVFTLR
jgi:hypothetical protein